MTLFSLAKKNITGNINHYFVYFVSLVFSMVIYYTFVSLQYSKKIQDSIELSETMRFHVFRIILHFNFVCGDLYFIFKCIFYEKKEKRNRVVLHAWAA